MPINNDVHRATIDTGSNNIVRAAVVNNATPSSGSATSNSPSSAGLGNTFAYYFGELSIGTVTSGETPSATITGEAPNQVLNLVLQKGDKGANGYSLNYVHEQAEASDTWIINHNLGKYPSVSIVDTAGTQFLGKVEYNDKNTCTVYINGATKGKAYLN